MKRLKEIIKLDNEVLVEAMKYFESLNITYQGLIDELKRRFSEDKSNIG
jgi:hypothetical protein